MAATKRLSLILEWLEEHPERYKKVQDKIKGLNLQYAKVQKAMLPLARTSAEEKRMTEALTEVKAKETLQMVGKHKNLKRMSDAIGLMIKRQDQAKNRLAKWSKSLMAAGWRVGWLSYRLVAIGRILMRWMTAPVKKTISILENWEKSLDKVAMTLGLLEARGLASSEMTDFLRKTLEKLPEVGLDFQAAMGALESVLIGIAVDVAPILTDVLLQLAEALLDVWNNVSPVLIPALEDLKNTVLPPLLDLIREMGPAIIMGFVEGVKVAVPLLIGLLNVLKPFLPIIAGIIGFLLPFAPLLILVGTALYFLSPILLAVAFGLKVLSLILPAASGGIIAMGTAVGTAGAAAAPAIPLILALGAAVLMAGAGFLMAGAGVMLAVHALILLGTNLKIIAPLVPVLLGIAAGMLGIAAAGIAMLPAAIGVGAMAVAILGLSASMIALAGAIWALVAAAQAFEAVGGIVRDVVGGITGALGGLGDALGFLCFKHAIPQAEAFASALEQSNREISSTIQDVSTLSSALREIPEAGIGGVGGVGEIAGPLTQYITIEAPIMIESVSAEVDLDAVQDAVNKGIAESLRRRRA